MKIYLAGEREQSTAADFRRRGIAEAASIWTKSVRRRLFSYYYHGFSGNNYRKDNQTGLSTPIAEGVEFGWDLFLDSGAFTAFTKNVVIPIEEYAEYVKKTQSQKIWTVCSSLDAIGQGREAAVQSYKYFARLRNLGAEVQPVFHVREPDEALKYYVNSGEWEYVFIGGMVPETTEWLRVRLDHLWSQVLGNKDGTPKIKTHGFGLTDQQLMFRYPWTSVDSSSWLMTGIFGSCMFRTEENKLRKVVFSDESPTARKFKGWHYKNLPKEAKAQVDRWLEPFEINAEQLSQHYSYRDVVNAAVFQSLEDLGTEAFIEEQPTLVA
jgi:hypothetical protein